MFRSILKVLALSLCLHSVWLIAEMFVDSTPKAFADKGGDDGDGDDGGEDGGEDGEGEGQSGQSHSGHGKGDKLDNVRANVRDKNLLPLWMVKANVIKRFGNSIVDTEINRKSGDWIYEFKVISSDGRLVEIYADAKTGKIIKVKND